MTGSSDDVQSTEQDSDVDSIASCERTTFCPTCFDPSADDSLIFAYAPDPDTRLLSARDLLTQWRAMESERRSTVDAQMDQFLDDEEIDDEDFDDEELEDIDLEDKDLEDKNLKDEDLDDEDEDNAKRPSSKQKLNLRKTLVSSLRRMCCAERDTRGALAARPIELLNLSTRQFALP